VNPVFIHAVGIHAEYCDDVSALHTALRDQRSAVESPVENVFQKMNVQLGALEKRVIAREDRSILNGLASAIRNAAGDMLHSCNMETGLDLSEETPLYSGTDGVAEHNFVNLSRLIQRHGSTEQTLKNLGELSGMANPINMMRFLSTNPIYHASKRLELRGGGYPVSGMSLSGLYALEDAVADLAAGRCGQGIVVAAGNMRNFDSLVVFAKLGLLDPDGDMGGFVPSFGAAMLLLGNESGNAVAEVLDVHTRYSPEPFPSPSDWQALMKYVAGRGIQPDVVTTYCNGVKANDEIERSAVQPCFPNAQLRNYKSIFGYTSKANNTLDLVAALADENIPEGAVILVNGAGFGVGIGFIAMRKLKQLPYSGRNADDALEMAA